MKKRRNLLLGQCLSVVAVLAMAAGCAQFTTKQVDRSYDPEDPNHPSREITTKASAKTFFSGKSDLAKFKATQTDKTQSATVGSLHMEGGQTNQLGDVAAKITEAAIRAAKTP